MGDPEEVEVIGFEQIVEAELVDALRIRVEKEKAFPIAAPADVHMCVAGGHDAPVATEAGAAADVHLVLAVAQCHRPWTVARLLDGEKAAPGFIEEVGVRASRRAGKSGRQLGVIQLASGYEGIRDGVEGRRALVEDRRDDLLRGLLERGPDELAEVVRRDLSKYEGE